jgi:hypothetical protein
MNVSKNGMVSLFYKHEYNLCLQNHFIIHQQNVMGKLWNINRFYFMSLQLTLLGYIVVYTT